MLELVTRAVTLLMLAGAAAVFFTYLVLELRAAFWSCPPDDDQELPDAEGEALPPAYVTGAMRLVDLAGADAAGIEPRGCWATVWRRDRLVDCGEEQTDTEGLCRPHREVLASIEEAGA